MPLLDLHIPQGAVAPDRIAPLLDDLAGTLLRWEGAPDNDIFRANTWVSLHERPEGVLYVGGRDTAAPRFRVDVTVPAGALDGERRAGLVADVTAAVADAAGVAPEDLLQIFVLIDEVPDGRWGAAGQVIDFAALRAAAKAQREAAAA